MWCSILLAAVMVAAAGGQSRFSYDGTPLADDVVVGSGQRQQFFASRQPQPQQMFVRERPQQVFVQQQPQPQPSVLVQPEPEPQRVVFVQQQQQPQPQQPVFVQPEPEPRRVVVVQQPQPPVFVQPEPQRVVVEQQQQPQSPVFVQPVPEPRRVVVVQQQQQPQPPVFVQPEPQRVVVVQQQQQQPQPPVFVQPEPQRVVVVQQQQQQQQPQPPVFVQPEPEPQQVFVEPQPRPIFQMFPAFFPQPAVIQSVQPQVSSACPATPSLVHTTYQRRFYHFSWCSQPGQGFSQSAARDYCRGLGELTMGNRRGSFDLYRVDRTTDFDFFLELLLQHQISSSWTRDFASTAPYEIRGSITRSGDSTSGQECLSLEASSDGLFLLEDSCSDQKAAICVADWES